IGPDPRNFNQRVSLGRNDLLIRTFPSNVGGFGDVEKASKVFVRNELIPLQKRLQELNDWLQEDVIRFEPYKLNLGDE
ncbi:hypothetical protein V5073_24680, partial [Citrobacter braakii]